MRTIGPVRLATSLTLLLTLTACAVRVGPSQLPPSRYHYNQAIASSWNEQLLLNLARLRYRDTPFFLEISSVLAQYSLTGTGSLSPSIDFGGDDSLGIGATLEYSETPTITFTPLQGSDFVESVLEPISPETLMLLSEAGWSIERLLACCVSALSGLENARAAAGPTPDARPRFEKFRRAASLLRALQVAGNLQLEQVMADGQPRVAVAISTPEDAAGRKQLAEVSELLGTRGAGDRLHWLVVEGDTVAESGEIGMRPRSLLGVLYFLSQGVAVPEADEKAGKVTITRDDGGGPFDWRTLTDGLLQVRWAPEAPTDAFVAVHYRDVWFYIADNDLDSKSTFSLLTLLFALQSANDSGTAPLVTVSSGG